MQNQKLISINEFCTNHNIELSFIIALVDNGLIESSNSQNLQHIHVEQLPQIERWIRMFYDLDINLEGIEAISHLLKRVSIMQEEMISLRNRLRIYEASE